MAPLWVRASRRRSPVVTELSLDAEYDTVGEEFKAARRYKAASARKLTEYQGAEKKKATGKRYRDKHRDELREKAKAARARRK